MPVLVSIDLMYGFLSVVYRLCMYLCTAQDATRVEETLRLYPPENERYVEMSLMVRLRGRLRDH